MQPAAGVKALAVAGGVALGHRSIEEGGKGSIGAGLQGRCGPAGERVSTVSRGFGQPLEIALGEVRMDLGNNFKIGDQRSELGGRAEIELGAAIDVEGLVKIVGLNAKIARVVASLIDREANHQRIVARIGLQEPLTIQP